MKYTCSMETVQQNGRFTLFSSKFLSIYSLLYVLISIYLQPYSVKLWHFKLTLFKRKQFMNHSFKYIRSSQLGSNNIGIRKWEFVAIMLNSFITFCRSLKLVLCLTLYFFSKTYVYTCTVYSVKYKQCRLNT